MKVRPQKTISSARSVALEVLRRVEAEGAYTSLTLNHSLRKAVGMDSKDRALTTELSYGTLRWRRKIDFAISSFSHRPLSDIEPNLLRVLRLSAYQILLLDRIPIWAAVDQGTSLASVLRGKKAAGFVNGLLRSMATGRDSIPWPKPESDLHEYLGVMHSFPDWMVRMWLDAYGQEKATALFDAINHPAPLWVRANTLRVESARLVELLQASGYNAQKDEGVEGAVAMQEVGDVTQIGSHEEGWFHVQNRAAQVVCHMLDAFPGHRILDACGAPGGKTATLAQLIGDRGEIFSVDVHPARLGLVRQLLDRLGIRCVRTFSVDLTRPPPSEWGQFDRVLLDAPCSSLGVLRRHPEGKWRVSPDDPRRLAQIQGQLLDSVSAVLKPGGILVYSVCTLTPDEGEAVKNAFLAKHPEFEPAPNPINVHAHWKKFLRGDGVMTTFPDRQGMDGFYAVRLRRRG